MLFSNDQISRYINDAFEPVYEMVRPVPIVTIDFGNGTVITRTLHGNIATYMCTDRGEILDILPGIYEPSAFRDRLDQLGLLAEYARFEGIEKQRQLADVLLQYHRNQAGALQRENTPPRFVRRHDSEEEQKLRRMMNMSKKVLEGRTELIVTGLVSVKKEQMSSPAKKLLKAIASLMPGHTESESLPAPISRTTRAALPSPDDLKHWQLLAEDTRINESVRRIQIHEKLAATGPVQPGQIKHWLYKEVLHADLDDPYLGLGEALFSNYPFQKEDSTHG